MKNNIHPKNINNTLIKMYLFDFTGIVDVVLGKRTFL